MREMFQSALKLTLDLYKKIELWGEYKCSDKCEKLQSDIQVQLSKVQITCIQYDPLLGNLQKENADLKLKLKRYEYFYKENLC